MQSEFGGDRSDLPMFGVEQVTDLGEYLLGDHFSPRFLERIHEQAQSSADNAPEKGAMRIGKALRFYRSSCWYQFRRGEVARRERARGSLIRHVSYALAFSVGPLTISMIQFSFRTLLVSAIGFTSLLTTCLGTAALATVALSLITGTADPKDGAASVCVAKSLTKNNLRGARHPSLKAGLDNGQTSWQATLVG
jgi:hypothetical protein